MIQDDERATEQEMEAASLNAEQMLKDWSLGREFEPLIYDAFLFGVYYARKAEREKILEILRGDECAGNGRLTWGPHIADWLEKKISPNEEKE